jgi:hypothetical protein
MKTQKLMSFMEFMEFIKDGDHFVKEGHKITPMPSLADPFYTVWCFHEDTIERMKRSIE